MCISKSSKFYTMSLQKCDIFLYFYSISYTLGYRNTINTCIQWLALSQRGMRAFWRKKYDKINYFTLLKSQTHQIGKHQAEKFPERIQHRRDFHCMLLLRICQREFTIKRVNELIRGPTKIKMPFKKYKQTSLPLF